MIEEIYLIEGMSCAACSSAVERVTRKLEGVERSDVNLTTNRMVIYYDEEKVSSEAIMAKVKKAGFGIQLYKEEDRALRSADGSQTDGSQTDGSMLDGNNVYINTYNYICFFSN